LAAALITPGPEMANIANSDTDVFPALLDANASAFAAGHYDTAYHALMAALHAAQDQHEPSRLERVSSLAMQQQKFLDQTAPQHRLSTASAGEHGHPGVYAQASRQAETQASLARLRRQRPEN
jgi:hypothetical protein